MSFSSCWLFGARRDLIAVVAAAVRCQRPNRVPVPIHECEGGRVIKVTVAVKALHHGDRAPATDALPVRELIMQMADKGNSERAASAEELGDDILENVRGGRDASSATIPIFREPTHHPSKVSIPD